jgi:hypothetical protein
VSNEGAASTRFCRTGRGGEHLAKRVRLDCEWFSPGAGWTKGVKWGLRGPGGNGLGDEPKFGAAFVSPASG